nr:hypothetical protein CFP56_35782 [Quercus suber]
MLPGKSKRKLDPKKGKSQSSGEDVVEVSPPVVGGTLEKKMAIAASQSREEEVPSGGLAEETGQPMQDVQAAQDPEASKLLASPGPQLEQTPSPVKTMLPQTGLSTKTLRGPSSSGQTGQAIVRSASGAATSLESEDSEASFKQSEGHEEGTPPQQADTGVNIEDPELAVPEGGAVAGPYAVQGVEGSFGAPAIREVVLC